MKLIFKNCTSFVVFLHKIKRLVDTDRKNKNNQAVSSTF
jgi:hypothetical protein